ncbi:MAG: serine/threonine-protein kinase, partial [Deltaproteobacteria bacterium]|nr:serine/threonine-protein kinase [Deltaproteobacteria bacterium]
MIGKTLGHYEILSALGKGGMGEVYRARDTKLGREVAIKVLPADFGADQERLQRFEREAKLLASLNHPGITGIFGLHETDGIHFLAMEYVPGENLAERLMRGAIPLDQALDIGRQIAEALEAAHEAGVVHRDLKPSNVVITPSNQVKVLDFGLAKAMLPEPISGEMDPALSPTITSPMTLAGTILGTAAYMSPEQARGGAFDKRADIWAFGCVLLEMLTGQRTFPGETVSDTLAAVLRADVGFDAAPNATPRSVRHLLERCLDRDPKTRLRDAGEARIVLSDPGDAADDPATAPATGSRTGLIAVLGIVALLAGLILGRLLTPADDAEPQRFAFEVGLGEQQLRNGSVALSPDGEKLVMQVRRSDGEMELWLRLLGEPEGRALPGSVAGRFPFWSPDSEHIAFFAKGQLHRIALDGTSARPICTVKDPLGGSWNGDNIILFGETGKGLHRVDANGGGPAAITKVQADEEEHIWPVWLPDDKHFLFLADANTERAHRLCLTRLGEDEVTVLRTGVRSSLGYDPQVGVLFVAQNQLLAFPLDLSRRQLGNEAVLVSDKVTPSGTNHHSPFSLSRNGILAVQHGSDGFHMLRTDLDGSILEHYGEVEPFANPAVSPDGRRILFEIHDSMDERLIWMLEHERGVRTVVSVRNTMSDSGTWSADGNNVYFDSNADSTRIWSAFKQAVDGGGEAEFMGRAEESEEVGILDSSPDGQWLLVFQVMGDAQNDIALGKLDADGMVTEWINWTNTPGFTEERGAFSPDSRYIVYASDASGRREIYLAPTLGGPTERRWQVSTTGGTEPRFSPDGRFIYYRAL